MMANESLYLVEGNEKAVLIDAGTKIMDLDKIVASITKKPVMLVATHAHPDHTGSAINYFPELNIAPGDAASQFVANYKGKVKELKDGQIIELGRERIGSRLYTGAYAGIYNVHRQKGRLRIQWRFLRLRKSASIR